MGETEGVGAAGLGVKWVLRSQARLNKHTNQLNDTPARLRKWPGIAQLNKGIFRFS